MKLLKSEITPNPEASIHAKMLNLLFRDMLRTNPVFTQETPPSEIEAEIELLSAEEKIKLNSLAIQVNNLTAYDHAWKVCRLYRGIIARLAEEDKWSDLCHVLEGLSGCVTDVAGTHLSPQLRYSSEKILENLYAILTHLQCMLKEPFYLPANPSPRLRRLQMVVRNIQEKTLGFPHYELALKNSLERISMLSDVYLKYETQVLEAQIMGHPLSEKIEHDFFNDYLAISFARPVEHIYEDKYALVWAIHKTRHVGIFQDLHSKISKYHRNGPEMTEGVAVVWSALILRYQNDRTKSTRVNAIKSIKTMQVIFQFLRGHFPKRNTLQLMFIQELLCTAKNHSGIQLDLLQEISMPALVGHLFHSGAPAEQVLNDFKKANPFAMEESELSNDYAVYRVLIALLQHAVYNAPDPGRVPASYSSILISLRDAMKKCENKPTAFEASSSSSQTVINQSPHANFEQDKSAQRKKYLEICLAVFERQSSTESRINTRIAAAAEKIKNYFEYSLKQSPTESIQNFLADYFAYFEARKTPPTSPFYQGISPLLSDDFLEEIQFLKGREKSKCIANMIEKMHDHLRYKNLFSLPETILFDDRLRNKVIHDLLASYYLTVRVPGNGHRLALVKDIIIQLNVEELPNLLENKSKAAAVPSSK